MRTLRLFRLIALLEGLSFVLLLFVAMPLKYLLHQPLAVRVVGMTHGVLFIAYVVLLVQVASEQGWPLRRALLGFVASLLPFGPFVFDRSLEQEVG